MDEFPYFHWYERLRWSFADLVFGFLLVSDVFEMVEDPSGLLATLAGGAIWLYVLHVGFIRSAMAIHFTSTTSLIFVMFLIPVFVFVGHALTRVYICKCC